MGDEGGPRRADQSLKMGGITDGTSRNAEDFSDDQITFVAQYVAIGRQDVGPATGDAVVALGDFGQGVAADDGMCATRGGSLRRGWGDNLRRCFRSGSGKGTGRGGLAGGGGRELFVAAG